MKSVLKIILIASFLGVLSCKKDGKAFDRNNGDVQKKPVVPEKSLGAPLETAATPVFSSEYDVSIKTRSGTTLCKGHTKINVNSNFSLAFADSALKCLTADVDMSKLLGSANGGSGGVLSDGKKVTSDGKVLRVSSVGNATFNPPRPLLMGPVVQDVNSFQGFSEEKAYAVQTVNPNASASGTIRVEVEGINESYKPATYAGPLVFNKIMRWKLTTTGFDGIAKAGALLFDSMEFYWNINPIAIPRMVIESNLTELTKGTVIGGNTSAISAVGDALLGKLTIELILTRHDAI